MRDARDRSSGILSGPVDGPGRLVRSWPTVEVEPGTVLEHRASRFTGRVVRFEPGAVVLRSQIGTERSFRLQPGAFGVDGRDVTVVAPARAVSVRAPATTASGSTAVSGAPARVARASRILVEGVHDAELVELVWGDDLRVEGVVVERLDGVDVLPDVLRALGPGPARRVGVLVDHLVPGSKESRIAAAVIGPWVAVTGTPYVDVWQAIRPHVVGIGAWPEVPRGVPWKDGVCHRLGWREEPGAVWRRLLASVRSYADLEPALVGAVEQLIDFVTAEP